VAESGKDASFLAGGEIPIPVAQGTGGNVAISVQYKEFGVRLSFTPVINGNRVHLKVKPEVSTLDFANSVSLQGFRIPALSTRRTETELELADGQTFAIAGLLNNNMTSTLQKIPGIGDIPILGLLFKSKAAQKNQTELVVMITPQILQRTSPGVTPNLPRQQEPYLPPMSDKKTFEAPPPAFGGVRGSADAGASTPRATVAAAPAAPATSSPAAAAAAVSALTPSASAPRVQPTAATPAAGSQPQPSGQPLEAKPLAGTAAPAEATPPAVAPQDRAHPKQTSASRQTDAKADGKANKEAERAAKEAAKAQQRQDEINRNAEKAEQQRQAAFEREKAKLEKEKAKRDAEAAKVAAEKAKKDAEAEKVRQKALDDAAAKVKEAEARYQALSKNQK
jgi:hypothetical protein